MNRTSAQERLFEERHKAGNTFEEILISFLSHFSILSKKLVRSAEPAETRKQEKICLP